jgi:hypothetical protein
MTNNKMEEQKYPIYSFSAKWSQDGKQSERFPDKDLPEGRISNGTRFTKMFKEKQTEEQLQNYLKEWVEACLGRKMKKASQGLKNPELIHSKVEYVEDATWNLTWFAHETFDTGQTDEEVLKSFNKFVDEKQRANIKKGEEEDPSLMGAEDRWRWRGRNDDDTEDTEAPCRCKHCKEQGFIRIIH